MSPDTHSNLVLRVSLLPFPSLPRSMGRKKEDPGNEVTDTLDYTKRLRT